MKEVSSALLCHSPEEKGTTDVQGQSTPEDFHPLWGKSSQREREGSLDRSLARVCKAHRKVLLAAATLEKEIEKLHRMRVCSSPEWRHKESQRPEERRRKRQHQVSLSSQPTAS